jgi:multidrug transporter EmrE-like cation transporter
VLGLEAVIAVAIGMFVFQEPMSVLRATGIVLVVGGVCCLRA